MASPFFRPMHKPTSHGHVARSLQTALFVHRMKSIVAKPKQAQAHVGGHPIIHQPIVVRPARPSHTNTQSNLPLY